MLQAVIIHQQQDYTCIPLTSIVRSDFSQNPFTGNETKFSPVYFRIIALGADIQLLECLIFGGESANILSATFRRLGDAYPTVDIYDSDLLERYFIQ